MVWREGSREDKGERDEGGEREDGRITTAAAKGHDLQSM